MNDTDFFNIGIEKGKALYNDYVKLAKKIEKAYGKEAEKEYKKGLLLGFNNIYQNIETVIKNKHK